MPLRTRSGISSGVPLAAAPSATAASAHFADGYRGRVGGQGGGAGGDGGEVGDKTPRFDPAALWTLGRIVSCVHRTHQLEVLLAVGASVLVESHNSYLSINGHHLAALILPFTESDAVTAV